MPHPPKSPYTYPTQFPARLSTFLSHSTEPAKTFHGCYFSYLGGALNIHSFIHCFWLFMNCHPKSCTHAEGLGPVGAASRCQAIGSGRAWLSQLIPPNPTQSQQGGIWGKWWKGGGRASLEEVGPSALDTLSPSAFWV